ncbi:ABC transporter substrate-binding protein [Marinobacterium aestuariivivens]|uniref:ABC transporter substrate-binding protein n=1 Tax=Marinobacterium aestuariivivens TaxID=1698799 RepID=A0ABW2A761_9GAMM
MRVLMLLALGLWLTGCGAGKDEPLELRIGLIAPISGALTDTGRTTLEGAELAVAEINRNGTLRVEGRQVRLVLVTEDNEDRSEAAVSAVLKLVNQEGVAVIVGPQASRNAIPAARAANELKIPLISPASTHPETTRHHDWVFRVAFTDSFQAQVLARLSREYLGMQRVAVLFDIASAYNRNLAEEFRDRFRALGGEIVAFEAYTRDAPDIGEPLARIAGSGAEGVFLPNYYNEVPQQIRQLRAQGMDPVWIGSDSWAQIPPVHRRLMEGAYFSALFFADSDEPKVREFVARYRERYEREPTDIAALTYDGVGLLAAAVSAAGSLEPGAIRDSLATLDRYQGVTGEVTYTGSGDPVKSATILRVEDGRFVFHARIEP